MTWDRQLAITEAEVRLSELCPGIGKWNPDIMRMHLAQGMVVVVWREGKKSEFSIFMSAAPADFIWIKNPFTKWTWGSWKCDP